MAKDFNTNIDLNKNSVVNGKLDTQTSLPTTNLFEGRIITHQGQVYIYYNGSWLSKADLATLAEKADLATLAEKADLATLAEKADLATLAEKADLATLAEKAELATLAEKAELAEDLVGRPEVYNEEFTFQPSANTDSVKDGLAIIKSINGNTVVANQLVNGSENLSLISGRKYYLNIQGIASIITATSGQVLDVNEADIVIDLTQMFNTGNEPATVEDFERLYPNLPTEYNKGSLLNLNAKSIKSVGFNAFNGAEAQVIGGQTYFLNGEYTSLGFKENENSEVLAFELPTDRLYTPISNGYIVAEGSDICINLSHSGYRNGEYEPYKESIANLPLIKNYFPDGMKSAGDVRDEIVWDKSIGKYKAIKRIGSANMGNLYWTAGAASSTTNTPVFYTVIGNRKSGNSPLKTPMYIYNQNSSPTKISDKQINGNHSTNIVYILDSSYTNVAPLKASLQGQILYYELATPTETIIDDYNLIDYEVSDFGTEEILSDEPTTPIVTEIQYGFNAVDVIRNNLFSIKDLFKLLLTKLSLTGGTMSGAIDMSTNPFIKAGFEYVEELPTDNNFIGRQVFYNNKPYYYTGKEWITFPDVSGKLSLTGGTMSGAIDMSSNPFITAGFEVMEELPTNNNFIGRQVFYNNKPYYYTGKEWITFPENSGGGEPTGDFWNLLEANPEVIASSYLPADDSVGVFEYLHNREELKKSRDIVVDFSRYQGGRIFRDFFSAYIDEVYAVYPYEWAFEQETDLRYTRFKIMLTNNPFTYPIAIMVPDSPIIKTNFSEVMTGATEYPNEEQARFFYLYPNSSVMVDFELQQHENSDYPIIVNITAVSSFGTATFDSQRCSTEENQTIINNYLDANEIPYSTNKITGEILYNAQDLLASICSKLK